MVDLHTTEPVTTREDTRAKDINSFWWHLAFFVVVNAWLWFQDIVLVGGGLEWAYWTTIPWGIGLVAHFVALIVSLRRS